MRAADRSSCFMPPQGSISVPCNSAARWLWRSVATSLLVATCVSSAAGGAVARGDLACAAAGSPREELLGGATAECRLPVPIDWGPPLPPPLRLTGTFGEHRSGHLHAGIDLSTGGRIGMPVLAVADGSIVRMRAGSFGYGRALYLQTDAGPLAVYGHLERFAPALEDELHRRQAAQGEFEIDCAIARGAFRFACGETLAISGATGAGPPHLHFELRDGDVPVNPLICGLAVPDLAGPEVGPVALHALDAQAAVAGGASFVLASPDAPPPIVWGRIGLEAYLIDRSGTTGARLAPLAVRLFVDGQPLYERRFTAFEFGRGAEVERIYGRLARDQGPFALRVYRWPPGAPADQTERGDGCGLLRCDDLATGRHRLCLEVVEAGGYASEETWEIDVRPPLLPREWQSERYADGTWQLGLRLAEPFDSLRLPIRLRRCELETASDLSTPGEPCGSWAGLGDGWFAAPLSASRPMAVRVTDDRGTPLLPWIALAGPESAARAARSARAELQITAVEFHEGFASILLRPAEPLRGLPYAELESVSGRRWPLALRGAADERTWCFGLAPGGFEGRSAALVLSFGDQGPEERVALTSLIGIGARSGEGSWTIVADAGVRLCGNTESFYGPAVLQLCRLGPDDPDWANWVSAAGRVAWRREDARGEGLMIRGPLWRIAPAWWPLQSGCQLRIAREILESELPRAAMAAGSDGRQRRGDDPRCWGLCRCDADGDWSWVGGRITERELTADLSALGLHAVLCDLEAPVCSDPAPADGSRNRQPPERLMVRIREIGSGFDPRAADLFLDGAMLLATWDVDERLLWADVDRPLEAGRHDWEVRVTDRAGNHARAEYRFTLGD